MKINILTFKKIIIIYWTFWWLIALWTDIVGGLAHLEILKTSWAPDLNYPALLSSLKMYSAPPWIAITLFIGIIFWSFLSASGFIWASISLHKSKSIWIPRASLAFIISITYWLAFFLADQMVMKFDIEENHMVQGGFELLTFLSLYLLPDV